MVSEACFLLAILPTSVLSILIIPSISNIFLYGLFLLPVGPAWVALLANVGFIQRDNYDHVFKGFWKRYKSNFVDSLKLTLIYIILIAIFLLDMEYIKNSRYSWIVWLFLLFCLFFTVLFVFSFSIAARFKFNAKSFLLLSISYLLTDWITTLKFISYIILLGTFFVKISMSATPLLAIFFSLLINRDMNKIMNDIKNNYTK